MAYTSLVPVRRLDSSIRYILNPEKTEKGCFASALGCTCETAFADMKQVQKIWKKPNGVQGYHLVQSFAPGEASPALAHEIGVELARRLLKGEYQAVAATHVNTNSVHNHILWNAVSLTTGKKYHSNIQSYMTEVRRISDALCREHGLSVIQSQGEERVGMPYVQWMAEKKGQPTWKTAIRKDVDEAISLAFTWNQFLAELKQQGYMVRLDRSHITLQPPGKERPVRFKTLGQRYTPEAIQQRILQPKAPKRWEPPKRKGLRKKGKPLRKLTGLQVLYLSYLYKMGVMKRKPQRISYAVREDLCRLDKRLAQLAFLRKNGVHSREQLNQLEKEASAEIEALLQQRKTLYASAPENGEIPQISQQLQDCRKAVKLCREIAWQSQEMEQRLTAKEKQTQQVPEKSKIQQQKER